MNVLLPNIRAEQIPCLLWNYGHGAEVVGSGSYNSTEHSEVISGSIIDGAEMIERDARTPSIQQHLCLQLWAGIKKTLWFVLCFLMFSPQRCGAE